MMREIFRLAWFEWRNVSVRGIGAALFVLVCYSFLFSFVADLTENEGLVLGLDFFFILAIILWIGTSQFSGEPFNLLKMHDGMFSTAFYRYTKRLPVLEVALFRSRLLVKAIYLGVLMFLMVSLVVIVDIPALPFTFGNHEFFSFAAFWMAAAMISTMNAINEIGYSTKEDTKMNLKTAGWLVVFLVFYLVIWVWLIPYNGTFVRFTIEYSAAHPTAMLAIAGVIAFITLLIVEISGRKKIKNQGV